MSSQRWSHRLTLGALCVLGFVRQLHADSPNRPVAYCANTDTASTTDAFVDTFQSYGKCTGHCVGFAFAILQSSSCWCSNFAPSANTTGCTDSCPGYPTDNCGSKANGLFAYYPVGSNLPSGTIGAATSSAAQVTVTATPGFITIIDTDHPNSAGAAVSSTTTSDPTPTSSQTSSIWTPTPVTSLETVTGQVRTVTITPTVPPNAPSTQKIQKSASGLGTGGAVGLSIGLVALVAIVGSIIWFCLKRRRQEADEDYNNINGGRSEDIGPIPSRTMSQNSRYILGTDGRQVVEGWEQNDTSAGSRRSRLMPVDPRLNPFAPVYQRDNKSRESVNTIRDDHDYSRRVVHQGPILRATNPDHPDD